ncbi:DUF5988 family protein [Streptacidiphilus sp. PAMC 29251]
MPRTMSLTAVHQVSDELIPAAESNPDCRVLLSGGPAAIATYWLLTDGARPGHGDRVTVTHLGRRHHFEFTGGTAGTLPVFNWIYVTAVAE